MDSTGKKEVAILIICIALSINGCNPNFLSRTCLRAVLPTAPAGQAGTHRQAKKGIWHRVKKKDTLWSISRKYKVPVWRIKRFNSIKNVRTLKPGRWLFIPSQDTRHKIQDTRYKTQNARRKTQKRRFYWPIHGKVKSRFGIANGVKNIGIDVLGKPGQIVKSSLNGRVQKIGIMRGYGKYVIILHSNHWTTVYAHLGRTMVAVNERVSHDTPVGVVGRNSYIHFEIHYRGVPQNPLNYLR